MDKNEIIKIYGLPEDATDEQIAEAVKAGAQAIEQIAGERDKTEAAETAKAEAESEKDKAIKEKDEAVAECRAMKADAFVESHKDQITDTAAAKAAYIANPELAEQMIAACKAAEPTKKQQILAAAKGNPTAKKADVLEQLAACKSAQERVEFVMAHAKEIADAQK